jgi:hypothetical protein
MQMQTWQRLKLHQQQKQQVQQVKQQVQQHSRRTLTLQLVMEPQLW